MMLIIILMFTTKSVEPTILSQKLSAWSREPPAQHNKNSFTKTLLQTCNNITLVSEPNASVLGQTFLLD